MSSSMKKKGVTSPYTTQLGHLKGHISVKSNAFSPTCKRLSSQDMVIDNMVAHTQKINSVKPRIDNSVPKTWTTSIKKKDQLRRQAMEKDPRPSRPTSASRAGSVRPAKQHHRGFSSAPVSPANMEQYLDGASYRDDEVLSDMYDVESPYQTPRSLQSLGDLPPRQRSFTPSGGQQVQTTKSFSINGGRGTYQSQMVQMSSRQQSHDLLDTMATRFTEKGKSHTPRTLRTSAKSKLAQSKYYNPPKRKEKQANRPQDNEEDKADSVRSISLDKSLRRREHHSGPVERRKEDHIKWVEEQAERVHHLGLNESFDGDTTGRVSQVETTLPNTGTNGLIYSARLETMSYRSRSQNEKRMREEEEELRYLEFVTDVTNDVLNRGIYTNTVLKQVFEAHIDRNKEKLEEERMRQLMKQLQKDLAIPGDDR